MNHPTPAQGAEALIRIGKRLYEAGLNRGTDGNFSLRTGENAVLATCSGCEKGFLTPEDLVLLDLGGHVLSGRGRPSSEIKLHLRLYQANPRAMAAVHAHPVHATALASAGLDMVRPLLPPVVMQLGPVHTAPYALPGSDALADSILPFCQKSNAVLLANHGALTWGATAEQALTRMETLEQCAAIYLAALAAGSPQYLSPEEAFALHARGVELGNFPE